MMIWVTTCYQGFANTTDRLDQIDASVSDTFQSDKTILIPGRSKTQILEIPEAGPFRHQVKHRKLRGEKWSFFGGSVSNYCQ